MKITVSIFILLLSAMVLAQNGPIAPGPYVLKPGIIRPTISTLNITYLNIPRGGAIVKPVLPINNALDVEFAVVITGQACDINDPLVLMYQPLFTDGESGSVIMTLPSDFFYYATDCGGEDTTIDLSTMERWVLSFRWDGQKFVNAEEACPPVPPPAPPVGVFRRF